MDVHMYTGVQEHAQRDSGDQHLKVSSFGIGEFALSNKTDSPLGSCKTALSFTAALP